MKCLFCGASLCLRQDDTVVVLKESIERFAYCESCGKDNQLSYTDPHYVIVLKP